MTTASPTTKKIGEFSLEANSIEEATDEIFKRLARLYGVLQPDKSASDFFDEILTPLYKSTPETPASISLTIYANHSQHTYQGFLRLILTTCQYCIEAETADDTGLQVRAWRLIGDAMYQLGILEATIIIEPAIANIISDRSATGAKGRDKKYDTLRELAEKLAQEKPFKSKRQAALSIKDEILAKARLHGTSLSEMQAERTITSWLKNIPFGSKREP